MKPYALFAVILAVFYCAAPEAQVLGTVDYREGEVKLTRNGERVASVDIGTKIENLDIVETSPDSSVSFSFDKASGLSGTLRIVPSSRAIIRQDQLSGSSASEIQLLAGSVALKVKRLAGGSSSVQVRTPTSVMGVRGTEFAVSAFNGSAVVACREGEVFCSPSADFSVSRLNLSARGSSSVPGTMVEVLESGSVNTGSFPPGDFDENWKAMRSRWKAYNVGLVASDPVSWLNMFAATWSLYAVKVESSAQILRGNTVLAKWLKGSSSGTVSGTRADRVQENPVVMKDLVALRPDMMIALMTWTRLEDLVPNIPESAMTTKLSSGQSVRSFIEQYNRQSKTVFSALALFNAAEKQYMMRNDGVSPFSEF